MRHPADDSLRFGACALSVGCRQLAALTCLLMLFVQGCDLPRPAFSEEEIHKQFNDSDLDDWPACTEANVGKPCDCDDMRPTVYPAATELCDGLDNDCNGFRDDGLLFKDYFLDADLDGHGNPVHSLSHCEDPAGYVLLGDDCDDTNSSRNPALVEVCDGLDNDCDGEIDDGLYLELYYPDTDGDGYGAVTDLNADGIPDPTASCQSLEGFVTNALDCEDVDPGIHPYAEESCDDASVGDLNCDGSVQYQDLDADGAPACEDCDDIDPERWPGRAEVCDGKDNDCDVAVDEEVVNQVFYQDSDGDGFGTSSFIEVHASCSVSGWSLVPGDCNDDPNESGAAIHPSAVETCDLIDNNCNGTIDEGYSAASWFEDRDGDGYGNPQESRVACTRPEGFCSNPMDCNDDPLLNGALFHPYASEDCGSGVDYNCDGSKGGDDQDKDGRPSCQDCNDSDPTVYGAGANGPAATESCDGRDNDCNGVSDDVKEKQTFYPDRDGDGFGKEDFTEGETLTLPACAISGWSRSAVDCDDGAKETYHGAPELCDGQDNDCDGIIPSSEQDQDGDGARACASSTVPADCNDLDSSTSPLMTELCDGKDNDCDQQVDEGAGTPWYLDADADGWGDVLQGVSQCSAPPSHVARFGDCDDSDPMINPDATEVCDPSNVDEDCTGLSDDQEPGTDWSTGLLWYVDADGDGYGTGLGVASCEDPSTSTTPYSSRSGDCDDGKAAFHPGALDVCGDPTDYNCDGSVGTGDSDGDGITACLDCNDSPLGGASIYPGALERCNGQDDDCDLQIDESDAVDAVTWYLDEDADGHGNPTMPTISCSVPADHTTDGDDCNDSDVSIHPGAPERCETAGTDDDCDGLEDEPDAADAPGWYADADLDGYGSATSTQRACSQPEGFIEDASDCDDTSAFIHPGATETCDPDNTDENCNGVSDDLDSSTASSTRSTWYVDQDGDGYGSNTQALARCDAPTGYVSSNTDCDDRDASNTPESVGACPPPVLVCDELSSTVDQDLDGYRACEDCNDQDATINPGVPEVCDAANTDENCNGVTDNSDGTTIDADRQTWFADVDGDGFGDPLQSSRRCDDPSSFELAWVLDGTDCDDTQPAVHPGAAELCATTTDDNCDGVYTGGSDVDTAWYLDGDGDGFGDAASGIETCSPPEGYVRDATDCDDSDPSTYPGAPDDWLDDVDSDCDGFAGGDLYVSLTGESPSPTIPAFTSVQAAIAAAQEGQTILVAPGTYYEALDFLGKDVAVVSTDGPEVTTLDGRYNARSVVRFVGGETAAAVLQGFTLTAGFGEMSSTCGADSTYRHGGGICIKGSSPTLRELLLTGNTAQYGSGLYVQSGDVTLVNSRIWGNSPALAGGGFYATSASIRLERVEVSSQVTSSDGAGMYLNGTNAVLEDVEVEGCISSGFGGGIFATSTTITASRLTLDGNIGSFGGGLYLTGSGTLTELVARDNVATSTGGGVYLQANGPLSLTQATLAGNSVSSGSGGGAYISGNTDQALTLHALEITDNSATNSGGGLYLYGSGSSLTRLTGSLIARNEASSSGGGLYVLNAAVEDVLLEFNRAAYYGGGLQADGAALLRRIRVIGNYAGSQGGGVYVRSSSNPTFYNSLILDNEAKYGGGGAYLESGICTNVTLSHNRSGYYGGGAFLNGSNPLLYNSILAYNQAIEAGSNLYVYGGSPLVVSSCLYNPPEDNSSISGITTSTLEKYGYIFADPGFIVDPRVSSPINADYHLRPDAAARDAGASAGAYNDPDGTRNDMGAYGGPGSSARDDDLDGLPDDWEAAKGLNPAVTDGSLDSDQDGLTNLEEYALGIDPLAPDSDRDGQNDGQERAAGTHPGDFFDPGPHPEAPRVGFVPDDFSTIQGALDRAGPGAIVRVRPGRYEETLRWSWKAIRLEGSAGPADTVIDAGRAGTVLTVFGAPAGAAVARLSLTGGLNTLGGGVQLRESPGFSLETTWIYDNLLEPSSSTTYGGGIYAVDSSLSLNNVWLDANSADFGGGLFARYTTLNATHLLVTGNSGISAGIEAMYGTWNLGNTITSGNIGTDGGGIGLDYGTHTLDHVVVSGNQGTYGSVRNYNSTLTIRSSVLAYNTPNDFPSATYGYSCSGSSCVPSFIDDSRDGSWADDDYHPVLGSTALIDTGDPAESDADGTRSDIGAYGGPRGDEWDLDGDGYPAWFWPGTLLDAPSGFDPSHYDCDDLDPEVPGLTTCGQ